MKAKHLPPPQAKDWHPEDLSANGSGIKWTLGLESEPLYSPLQYVTQAYPLNRLKGPQNHAFWAKTRTTEATRDPQRTLTPKVRKSAPACHVQKKIAIQSPATRSPKPPVTPGQGETGPKKRTSQV